MGWFAGFRFANHIVVVDCASPRKEVLSCLAPEEFSCHLALDSSVRRPWRNPDRPRTVDGVFLCFLCFSAFFCDFLCFSVFRWFG